MNDLQIIQHLIHLDGEQFSDGEVIDIIDTYIELRKNGTHSDAGVPMSEEGAYHEIMAQYDFPGMQ